MVELSSLDVRALALELRSLEDAYIDKVYQTRADEFVLKLRHPEHGPAHLLLRSGSFAARAREAPETPDAPGSVAMKLRKHLASARIRRVDQHEFDRVLRFQLERGGTQLELVVELFGKGNVILAGPDARILFALREESFAHRQIKRGETLVLPPPRVNPVTMTRSQFESLAQASEKDVVRFLALDVALGGDLSEELVHRGGVDKSAKANTLEPLHLERLWTALRGLLEQPVRPSVATTVQGPHVESVPLEAPLFRDVQREPVATLSEAILRVADFEADRAEAKKEKPTAKLERTIQHQERGVAELELEAARWERRGHLLFAHYQTGARLLQKAKAAVEAQGWNEFSQHPKAKADEPESWRNQIVKVDAKRGRVVVKIEEEEVPLDPTASLEHNATTLYDEAKRIRAKFESAKIALAESKKRLDQELAVPAAKTKKATGPQPPRKRFWFEAHRWFWSSEGFLVVGGRDAAGNEKLVKRHLSAGDRYVHADFHGAPSVVVKCEGRKPGEATMREACQFGATYSRAFAQFAAADAYWVLPEQVSKQAESGEFVPRGAFIIRGTRNYVPKLKLEVDLGILRLDSQGRPREDEAPHARLVGGPPAAMALYARRRARIERGDIKPTEAAKQVAPLFGVSVDEVVAALPAGTVRIVSLPEGAP